MREEKLVVIHGPGGNGKTKFIETVRATIGDDYVTGMAMETLMATKGDQHPTDVADLKGKRLAIATETEEGRRLAESKIKHLTGGDVVRAGTCGRISSSSSPRTRWSSSAIIAPRFGMSMERCDDGSFSLRSTSHSGR